MPEPHDTPDAPPVQDTPPEPARPRLRDFWGIAPDLTNGRDSVAFIRDHRDRVLDPTEVVVGAMDIQVSHRARQRIADAMREDPQERARVVPETELLALEDDAAALALRPPAPLGWLVLRNAEVDAPWETFFTLDLVEALALYDRLATQWERVWLAAVHVDGPGVFGGPMGQSPAQIAALRALAACLAEARPATATVDPQPTHTPTPTP